MREIRINEEGDKIVLSTPELDGYLYLQNEGGRANTTLLDERSCKKTFDCTAKELKQFLKEHGY